MGQSEWPRLASCVAARYAARMSDAPVMAAARAFLRRHWRALRRRPIGLRAVAIGPDRVFVDSVDRYAAAVAWKLGLQDAPARRLIEREVQAGMVAVDVGANLGWYSLALARAVGTEGRVYAVEPEPGNVELLSRALGGGRFPQVEIRQVAAADYSGWMTLYLGDSDRGDHRIFPAAAERRQLTVRAVSLDDLLAAAPRVDLIKLSVQGAEVSVLRGLRQTLARQPDLRLLCTVSPALLARAGAGPDALFEPLRAAGLIAHRITADGRAEPVHDTVVWSTARARGRLMVYFRAA